VNKASKLWTAAAVMGLVAGIWLGRPAYRRFKEKRSLRQARGFLEKRDYRNAALSLETALAINPSNVPAARLMADVLDEVQPPAALVWRQRVTELAPTINDRILLAATALRVEKPPFILAAQTLQGLRPVAETNIAYQLTASRLALRLNRLTDAEAHERAAAALEPTNRLHRLNLATICLQSPDTNAASVARRELAALVADPSLGPMALRSLITDSRARRDLAAAEEYSRQLEAQPEANFDDRLLRLTVLSQAKSAELAPTLGRVQRECATNSLKTAQMLSWMNGQGLAREALAWLDSLPASSRSALPVTVAEADCYQTLQDWPGLESRLNRQRWGNQEFLRLALMSRALREQHRSELGDLLWSQAVRAASKRTDRVRTLAQVTSAWGWSKETEELLWTMVGSSPGEEWALENLLQRYGATGDTSGLYRVFRALLKCHPDSIEFKNNAATAGLLLNRDLARSTELAREVYEAGPTNAVFVSTYAFALHRQSNTAAGLKLMQTLPAAELSRPNIAAYYGLLLAAAGQARNAQPFLTMAEKGPLLAEERQLLAQARESSRTD
jgi:predicted Zn-dependent protease